jgi:hypothetical protein
MFGTLYIHLPENIKPRENFETFSNSVLVVFQILTTENWNDILYPLVAEGGILAAIYLVSWIFLGNYVLLNLFLAILLDSFVDEDEEEDEERKLEEGDKSHYDDTENVPYLD